MTSDWDSAPPVIAYGWDTWRQNAIEAFQYGAVDFLEQPLDVQALKFALDAAYRRATLGRELSAARKLLVSSHVEGLLGNSKPMARVNEVIRKVAGVFTNVLITGESGTGKEVVARAIHKLSPRANKPFVAFSACAFPESLIEDELFGHERGAFTGASQTRRGRFEEAQGGTVFLDEIGDLALSLQAKLLRVLQERNLERLGSNVAHPLDVRVICATSRNLERWCRKEASARICISGFRWSGSICRAAGKSGGYSAAGGIFPENICQSAQQATPRIEFGLPGRSCWRIAGRAMCASCKT